MTFRLLMETPATLSVISIAVFVSSRQPCAGGEVESLRKQTVGIRDAIVDNGHVAKPRRDNAGDGRSMCRS